MNAVLPNPEHMYLPIVVLIVVIAIVLVMYFKKKSE